MKNKKYQNAAVRRGKVKFGAGKLSAARFLHNPSRAFTKKEQKTFEGIRNGKVPELKPLGKIAYDAYYQALYGVRGNEWNWNLAPRRTQLAWNLAASVVAFRNVEAPTITSELLPCVRDLTKSVITVGPGDGLVVGAPIHFTQHQFDVLRLKICSNLPGVRVVTCRSDFTFSVIRKKARR